MKKFFSSILFVLALMTVSVNAGTYVGANLSAGDTAVIAQPTVVTRMTFYSTNATPTIVRLYDGAITNVTGLYTNWTSYVTNEVSTYVNTTGTTNTQTNTVIKALASIVSAATNNMSPILTLVVPASNEPLVFDSRSIPFAQKVTLSNNLTGLSAIIDYRTP